jgi:hypothetical protein
VLRDFHLREHLHVKSHAAPTCTTKTNVDGKAADSFPRVSGFPGFYQKTCLACRHCCKQSVAMCTAPRQQTTRFLSQPPQAQMSACAWTERAVHALRGGRKGKTIRCGDQEEHRSSPVLPLMRDRGGGGGYSTDARDSVSCWWGVGGSSVVTGVGG